MEETSAMPGQGEPSPLLAQAHDTEALGRAIAASYRRAVEYYKREVGKSGPDAVKEVESHHTPAAEIFLQGLRDDPPDQVSWYTLRHLEEAGEPETALRKWQECLGAALDELRSGNRGANAVQMGTASVWEWARYSAILHELRDDWQPRSGIERTLIEQMAQAYTLQLKWTMLFTCRSERPVAQMEEDRWKLPHVHEQNAIETAMQMADRWNRIFVRCLRQLRDLRRYSPVVINNPGQVNVGQQQVNLSRQEVNMAGVKAKRGAKNRRRR